MKKEQPAASMPKEKSLSFRLSATLFFRQLWSFILLDLLILSLLFFSVFLWADSRCAEVAALVDERGIPSYETQVWMGAANFSILPPSEVRSGEQFTLHRQVLKTLQRFYASPDGVRCSDFHSHYTTLIAIDKTEYAIEVYIDNAITWGLLGMALLAALQLLFLIFNSFGNTIAVQKALRPIQELASTAKRLNSMAHLSRQEMDALTGELDKIGALDLDSRIDLPTTQKELRSLAHSINALLDRVNRAYRSQMQFVSDASHELRTPIAVIQGYAALLDRWGKGDPETRQESIDAIRSESKAMENLVEQLLFLARSDNDSQPVKKIRFDLSELAAEVLRDEILIHRERTFIPNWDGPVYAEGDHALLKQVMRILLDNSVKYSPPDGRIWLRLSNRDGNLRVTVQDEGMGMSPESLSRIFDRFYRTDESRTRQTGGTGLGLSIALWIIRRHSGWFEVVSREGFGTRMTFVLPPANETSSEHPE